ncbi:MAG: hypothetical protein ACREJD_09515 [Phycisphaerales bacterium]
MSKKSKFFTGKPFSVEVCDAIRHHLGSRGVCQANRKKAFEDREAALAELDELENEHGPDALKLKERHSDAVVQIDRLDTMIKFHNNQVEEAVEKADEPEFAFMYDVSDVPPPKPKTTKKPAGGKDTSNGAPVPDATQPDGWNQHLMASVNELDLRDDIKAKIVKAKFTTIGELHKFIETEEDLGTKLNAEEKDVKIVLRTVHKYVKDHTRADLETMRASGGGVK